MSQLILDLEQVQFFPDTRETLTFFEDLCRSLKLHILTKTHHEFQPCGLTILFLLSESHLSYHSFPEKKKLTLDIYSCRKGIEDNLFLASQVIENYFKAIPERKVLLSRTSL